MTSIDAFGMRVRKAWIVAGLFVSASGAALAAPSVSLAADIDPAGKPAKFEAGNAASYYVWRDGQGWHLRTTTKNRKRTFQGAVRVLGGEFGAVNTDGLEKRGDKADCWKLSDDRKELTFNLQTEKALDGFDFRLKGGATRVEFSLKIDGEEIKTGRIFIGAAGGHPEATDFSLPTRRQ
jgi:hypothetical protein